MSIQRMGDRDVIQIDRLMSLSQEAVQGVVHRLHAAIHCSGLYPPGHTLFHKRIQALHECLERLFLEAELLVIRCGQTLSINHTLLQRDAPENENSRKV